MAISTGTYRIKNLKSGTYFDNSAKKPQIIHGWDSRPDSENQKWHVEKLPGDQGYTLKNLASDSYAHANGSKNGTDVKASRDQPTRWDICDAGDGAYTIWLKGSKGVIDLDCGKSENGTEINIWESTGAKQQKWKFEKVGGGGASSGSGYGGGQQQHQQPSGYGGNQQQSGGYGQQQPIGGGSTSGGNRAPPRGTYNNPSLQPGRYVIRNCSTGTAIDLAGGIQQDGTAVTGWQYGGGPNQQWDLIPGDNGYTIKNVASGTHLGHHPSTQPNEGTTMCGHSHTVEWDVKKTDEGFQVFYAKTNWVLDLAGAGAQNGTKILLWGSSGAKNQKWEFQRV